MTLQRGRKPVESLPEITNIRPVERADLAHLTVRREPTTIQTLRDNHHRIARAVASGMSGAEIAATCGVSINRVSMLKSDPAFADLVAHYRAVITSEWAQADTVIEFMRTNALKAQAMISDKLDDASDKGEFLPTRDLLGIAELGLDRTGYGKVNKNLNINVDFAAKLEAARTRSARAPAARTIEATPAPLLSPQSAGVPSVRSASLAPRASFRRV
jgi:DNA-binding CsgD family transcriptional regulator